MVRVAIITEDDVVWALPTWERAVPLLRSEGFDVVGLWTCPVNMVGRGQFSVAAWYLKTFGILDFFRICMFAVLARCCQVIGSMLWQRCRSFVRLANLYNIEYGVTPSPNNERFITWLNDNEVDILLIMVGHILRGDVISTPRKGCINKHASILPASKGLFPYLWSHLDKIPQGVSFHEVNEQIDEGRILYQELVSDLHTQSMISFYVYVFKSYPKMVISATRALLEERLIEPQAEVKGTYYGLPRARDVRRFRKSNGIVIRWRDILKAINL